MLLFVSDLHLTDSPQGSTIDVEDLLAELRSTLGAARRRGVERATLVLLGDVFELLESERWLSTPARPWHAGSPEKEQTVAAVFDGIVEANRGFFTGLAALAAEPPGLVIEYLPGNHDRELNQPSGGTARRRLRELLPLAGASDALLAESFFDPEHRVLARHGHEWDRANRYQAGYAAIGDAVVVELLVRLPALVRAGLGGGAGAAALGFLGELDCVRPQHPRVLAQWLLRGLARAQRDVPRLRPALRAALAEVVDTFELATREASFEALELGEWWTRFLRLLLAETASWIDLVTAARWLPRGGRNPEPEPYQALLDLQAASLSAGAIDYLLSGHTHRPEVVPIGAASGTGGEVPLYVNTGTWRRAHRLVEVPAGSEPARFSTWREECVVAVFSPAERARGLPRHEVRILNRGEAHVF